MASIIYKTHHIFVGLMLLSDQVLSWHYQCQIKKDRKLRYCQIKENSRVIQSTWYHQAKLFLKEIITDLYFQTQQLGN